MSALTFAGPAPATAARGAVMVHGRGGSALDILGLGAALALPDVAFVAPEAGGRSWWPTSFLAPSEQMEPFVESGLAAIEQGVATLKEAGLPEERIALIGFSQGACLALEYAARRGGVGQVFGLSGGLVGTGDAGGPRLEELYGFAEKRFNYDADLLGTKVWMSVHEQDPHIPLARFDQSADVLQSLGAEVRKEVAPGPGHGILQADVTALRGVLNG